MDDVDASIVNQWCDENGLDDTEYTIHDVIRAAINGDPSALRALNWHVVGETDPTADILLNDPLPDRPVRWWMEGPATYAS